MKLILIFLLILVLFRFLRKIIFYQSYQGFQKAAEDFAKKRQHNQRPAGSVTIENSGKQEDGSNKAGEYIDYEEIP